MGGACWSRRADVMTEPDVERCTKLYRLADKLIAEASKDELAEAARIFALNLAQYQAKYGGATHCRSGMGRLDGERDGLALRVDLSVTLEIHTAIHRIPLIALGARR